MSTKKRFFKHPGCGRRMFPETPPTSEQPHAEIELLPCPFCGSLDLRVYHGHGGNKVKCFGCYTSGVLTNIWNRRASLPKAPAASAGNIGERCAKRISEESDDIDFNKVVAIINQEVGAQCDEPRPDWKVIEQHGTGGFSVVTQCGIYFTGNREGDALGIVNDHNASIRGPQADTERLDWLSTKMVITESHNARGISVGVDEFVSQRGTLREAIDAARQKES